MSVRLGQSVPDVSVPAYDRTHDGSERQFPQIKLSDYRGRWICLYFYPLDFTAVCPTEIIAFNRALDAFKDRNCELLAVSTDSVYSHKGWCDSHQDLKEQRHLMLADTTHQLAEAFGVLKEDQGIAYRGTFLIDPEGVVRWVSVNEIAVGRSVDEVLRVLDALQTDRFCPCNWHKGDQTLN
jgi:peroxiredoxin (alkyl hydroperoxide reductase subunit C)